MLPSGAHVLLWLLLVQEVLIMLTFGSSEGVHRTSFVTSVSSVQGKRSHMEDEVFVSSTGNFACVFDGHGGGSVSQYLRRNFYSSFLLQLSSDSEWQGDSVEAAFRGALLKCDEEVSQMKRWRHQGSTVVAICIHVGEAAYSTSKYLTCMNLGDSRAVLGCRRDSSRFSLDLSHDHKPDMPEERERIERLGGTVKWHGLVNPTSGMPLAGTGCYRVNGNLALSRAAGDHAERPCVTCTPDIRKIRLGDKDDFAILASDGLWDVFDSEEACAFIRDCESAMSLQDTPSDDPQPAPRSQGARRELMHAINSLKAKGGLKGAGGGIGIAAFRKLASQLLVEAALRRGSTDNITCVVIFLRD